MNANGNNQESGAHKIPADDEPSSASGTTASGDENKISAKEGEGQEEQSQNDRGDRSNASDEDESNPKREGECQIDQVNRTVNVEEGIVDDQGQECIHQTSSAYTNAPAQPNNMFEQNQYEYTNNTSTSGPQLFPQFDPTQQPPQYATGPPFPYHHPPQHSLVPLPAILPPMPTQFPIPPNNSNNGDPNCNNNLDATRQYYEARMREHAMQYANAAAGAYWAAARIACGDNGMQGMQQSGMQGGYTNMPNNNAMPSHYTPASAPSMEPNQQMISVGPRHKRTLWHPPASQESKSKWASKVPKKETNKTNHAEQPKNKSGQQQTDSGKKRSKKRDSGNDSVSSLGSESRDLSSVGGGGKGGSGSFNKFKGKKGNQRRRFNEDGDRQPGESPVAAMAAAGNGRQKRGLHHGHSSKSSFSSLGSASNNPHHTSSGRNKKKNRSQPESTTSGSIHLGGLIGKNGTRALHELCGKYRWELPDYNSVELSNLAKSEESNDGNSNKSNSFVITVHVNGVELGRGRGGNKNAAKQDASRKALAALVPGVVFDPNGVLLDIGSELLLHGSNVAGVADRGSKSLSLDELGPHLAAQLAIGGNANVASAGGGCGGVMSRPLSPDHSENSSISTAISEEVTSSGLLISGGPLSLKLGLQLQQPSPSGTLSSLNAGSGTGRIFSNDIYSGASSASEGDEDENAFSSRGASVCSTLLHAMWQIDERIREPPLYAFQLFHNSTNTTGQVACKRKIESPREVTVQRMFQCTASLSIYLPKHLVGDKDSSSIMDCWESPLDYLQSTCTCSPSDGVSRKRKDSFASQSTLSPHRPTSSAGEDTDEQEELTNTQKNPEIIQHKLESFGTGSTKRESKHKASTKLLSTLFPGCKGIVEVKAEAEAAREMYAAHKSKAANKTKRVKLSVSSPDRNAAQNGKQCVVPSVLPVKNDISLHGLSLSETREGSKRLKWSDPSNDELGYERQTDIDREVETALQSLQELDEEGQWVAKDLSFDDIIGKLVLRRMEVSDADFACALFNKTGSTYSLTKKKCSSNSDESVKQHIDSPDSDTDNIEDNHVDDEEEKRMGGKSEEKLELASNSILLVLSRAVAPQDPPLGCAILSLESPADNEEGKLIICRLGLEEHLPREQLVECLEGFAKNMNCNLNTSSDHPARLRAVSSDDIRSYLSRSISLVDSMKGHSSLSHLQSVKEEDSEEAEESEAGEECDKKADGGSGMTKGIPCKSSKRSRVAR